MNLKRFYDAAQAANNKVTDLATQINDLFEANQNEDAMKLRPALDTAKVAADEANQLYISMQAASVGDSLGEKFVPVGGDKEPEKIKDLRASDTYRDAFFDAIRNGVSPKDRQHAEKYRVLLDALTETGGSPAGAEGGFLLPVDFDNMIKELQRQAVDLEAFVNVESVTAYSGWRAVETAKAALPFAEITESAYPSADRIAVMESPTFTKIPYTMKKYGGYLPVSNDLLNDTPAAIMQYLAKWCGRKVSLTNTSLILAIINALTPVSVTDHAKTVSAIKTALNKSLDPAISVNSKIFCNQTGLEIMDQLEDGIGHPLLQPDPTNEMVKRIKGREVVLLSDAQWPNLTDGGSFTRIGVGDGTQLVTMFSRIAGEFAATTIGGDTWRNDNTEVRYILRKNAVQVDSGAMKLLKVTIPS